MMITAYNKDEAIEYLEALAFKLLMSEEVVSLDGEHAKALFDIVGGKYDDNEADRAIIAFKATQY